MQRLCPAPLCRRLCAFVAGATNLRFLVHLGLGGDCPRKLPETLGFCGRGEALEAEVGTDASRLACAFGATSLNFSALRDTIYCSAPCFLCFWHSGQVWASGRSCRGSSLQVIHGSPLRLSCLQGRDACRQRSWEAFSFFCTFPLPARLQVGASGSLCGGRSFQVHHGDASSRHKRFVSSFFSDRKRKEGRWECVHTLCAGVCIYTNNIMRLYYVEAEA